MAKRQENRYSAKWDVRTGSPRKLWRTLHDFLDDHGFAHDYEELKLDNSPIEGTATFSKCLTGFRDRQVKSPFAPLMLVFGVLLCITVLLVPLGRSLLNHRFQTIRTRASVSIEGEVYRARGANIQTAHAAEILNVVADTRITLEIVSGASYESDEDEITASSLRNSVDKQLETTFLELRQNLDSRIQETVPLIGKPEPPLLTEYH